MPNGKQVVSSLDRVLRWIMNLAAINILWFVYSLRGLIVGGVFPATVAALGVSRKLIIGEEIKIWKTYKNIYLQEFRSANILGWILTFVGTLLYLNYRVIANASGELLFVIPFAFYFILFFYFIIVLWSFPLLAHYKSTLFKYIQNAVIIGLTKIHYTFASGVLVFTVIYISLDFPGLIPFFSISIAAIGCMWISMQIFGQLDKRASFDS
ncbi:putative membrane protein YesL [Evansella vedderi]|uniref:Membrane protein YesL n=1 Tax=Evansella vedderi TaxID=38282 RepID=A0ABU0A2M9_9BACI|nr:YesL family protein [Evansella vedderi]MDQ0257364.1 putative membrane protein YesL [Evansella vedderi]